MGRMRKTTTSNIPLRERLTVDVIGLMGLTGLGKESAIELGTKSGARLKIGKRTLFQVDKVVAYLDQMAADHGAVTD